MKVLEHWLAGELTVVGVIVVVVVVVVAVVVGDGDADDGVDDVLSLGHRHRWHLKYY